MQLDAESILLAALLLAAVLLYSSVGHAGASGYLAAVPLAYLGGRLSLPVHFYKPLVGAVLIYAALKKGSE